MINDPHLDEAVREAHPEVVLAVLGRGVDQPSARPWEPAETSVHTAHLQTPDQNTLLKS